MKFLVVEDDKDIQNFIRQGLTDQGHEVITTSNGRDALKHAQDNQYHAIIMDRMIPKIDGLGVIKALREGGDKTPILILSALGDVEDRVLGLRSGGDDYLVKPFAFSELLARLESLTRRGDSNQDTKSILTAGDIEMNLLTRQVRRGGKLIDIQAREFTLLEYLIRHKNQIVTRSMLLEHVWDYHFDPQTNVIDVHISRLRSKIDKDFDKPMIRTIRGTGYSIDD